MSDSAALRAFLQRFAELPPSQRAQFLVMGPARVDVSQLAEAIPHFEQMAISNGFSLNGGSAVLHAPEEEDSGPSSYARVRATPASGHP